MAQTLLRGNPEAGFYGVLLENEIVINKMAVSLSPFVVIP